jgi:hypothetical protein
MPTCRSYRWTDRLILLHYKCFGRNSYKPKDAFTGPDQQYSSRLSFRLLIIIATKIHVTLNHFGIVFKFSLIFPDRLIFMHNSLWGIPAQHNNRRIVEGRVFFGVCSVDVFSLRSDPRLYNEGHYELVEYIVQSWGIQWVEQKPVYRVGVSVWNRCWH